jgi:hypothetical protein
MYRFTEFIEEIQSYQEILDNPKTAALSESDFLYSHF